MRSNLEGALITDCRLGKGMKFGAQSLTLGANYAVPADAGPIIILDPTGARDVTLPANPKLGDFYIIINAADAAEVITVKDSAGNALVPAITPTQSEIAIVFWTGAAWKGFVGLGA